MACHQECQLRRSRLQAFCLLTEGSVLTELPHYISSSHYKYVVVDHSKPFRVRDLGGCTYYCTPLEEALRVCCRIRALNRTWATRTFYISHSTVIAKLEASW